MSKLLTRDFLLVSAGNFFLFLSFYALMPLLPFFLKEEYGTSGSVVGLILGSYMIACIAIRPIAGYLLDAFSRRPTYLLAYSLFAVIFCGYNMATLLSLFVALRIMHGASFGMATVCGSTLVSQITPRERLGEGLGVYGLANTLSMCLGPMIAIWCYGRFSFSIIFIALFLIALAGVCMASLVRIPPRRTQAARRLTREAFILSDGWWMSLTQLLAYVPYGASMAYVAVYAQELGLSSYGGLYFTLIAIGLGIARPISGKQADHGHMLSLNAAGITLCILTFALLGAIRFVEKPPVMLFLLIGGMQGITYGILHPTFNTLFVKLAPEERRGAANSMCQTSNDCGNGLGMLIGSGIATYWGGYHVVFLLGSLLSTASLFIFLTHTVPLCKRRFAQTDC